MECPRCSANCCEQEGRCPTCGEPLASPLQAADSGAADVFLQENPADAIGSAEKGTMTEHETSSARAIPESSASPAASFDSRFAELVRMVAGADSPSGAASEPTLTLGEQAIGLREFLAEIVRISRQTAQERSSPELKPVGALYTARSFSSPEEMGRSIRAIRLFLHINERAAAQFEYALARIRGRIEATHWEKPETRKFWVAVERLFTESLLERSQLLDLQKQWTEASVDLYEFVLTHADRLIFEGRLVRSRDHESGRDFLQKLHLAKQCRDIFRRQSAKISEISTSLAQKWVADRSAR